MDTQINTQLKDSLGKDSKYSSAFDGRVYSGETVNQEWIYLKQAFGSKGDATGQKSPEDIKNGYVRLTPTMNYSENDITAAMELLKEEHGAVRIDYYDKGTGRWQQIKDSDDEAAVVSALPNGTIIHAGTDKVESSTDAGYGYAIKDGSSWRKLENKFVEGNFATGTFSLDRSIMAMINELGTEGIITPSGTLTALPSKTGIVPADLTKNLYDLGEVAPNLIKQLGKETSIIGQRNNSNIEDNSMMVENLYATFETDNGFDFEKLLISARQYIKNTKGSK